MHGPDLVTSLTLGNLDIGLLLASIVHQDKELVVNVALGVVSF